MNRTQTLLSFSLPPNTMYPRVFRELLAAKGSNIEPAFFHRDPETGRPAQGRAKISTVGGPTWVGILAQPGEAHLLYKYMGEITRVLCQHLGHAVPMRLVEHTLSIRPTAEPVTYRLSEICLRRRIGGDRETQMKRVYSKEKPSDILIQEILLRGLNAAARRYGFDLPTDNQIDPQVWIKKELGLRTFESGLIETSEASGLVIADVTMNLELGGMWLFGDLSSRGYGRMIRRVARPGIDAPVEWDIP